MCRRRCSPVPGPASGLAVEHAQLVVDTLGGDVVGGLLLLSGQVAEDPVDGGDLQHQQNLWLNSRILSKWGKIKVCFVTMLCEGKLRTVLATDG